MIIFTTAGGYIYNMTTDEVEDAINYSTRYRLFGAQVKAAKIAIFICFFSGFLFPLPAGWAFVLYGGIVHFLASLYSRPLRFSNRPTIRIKEIPFLRNIYAGIFWSAALILTPYFYVEQNPDALAWLMIGISFGLNYFVELLWDLRDMPGDQQAGVRTVPLVIGEKTTYWILRVAHVLTCLLILWGVWIGLLLSVKGFIAVAIYFPIGVIFLEWYRQLPNKTWASHQYILYAGSVLLISMALEITFRSMM